MKNSNLSIGIFGGLFDPPHIGHLILSQWVLDEFNLDRVIFIPAFKPPHKHKYSSYFHRFEMTKRAIQNNRNFSISDIEKRIKGTTYTFEVIRALRKSDRSLSQAIFYLIIGADQWQEILHWKNPRIIFNESKIIVLSRPGYEIKKFRPFYDKILISTAPLLDISSTMIRKRIMNRKSIDYLVVPEVLRYIRKNKMYL
ncbi:MAG: nicotinate-nucleotide adenylyltransferase [candidate division WOR-3 bacterium]